MATDLKYDLDEIGKIKKSLAGKNKEITELSSALSKKFKELEGQWNTVASKKFFEIVDGEWADGVTAASKVLTDLEDALADVISEYAKIEDEAKKTFTESG